MKLVASSDVLRTDDWKVEIRPSEIKATFPSYSRQTTWRDGTSGSIVDFAQPSWVLACGEEVGMTWSKFHEETC